MELLKSSVIIFHLLTILSVFNVQAEPVKKYYIVYLGAHNHDSDVLEADDLHSRVSDSHHEFLASFLGSKEMAKESILTSYKWHINGFAAFLNEEEAAEIANHPKVVSVFANKDLQLHTTRTWGYMMLEDSFGVPVNDSIWTRANFGRDVIIANVDTGVWPSSQSFNDSEYGPIPSRWNGSCGNYSDGFTCNRKLIGAKLYRKGFEATRGKINSSFLTPRDHVGHGTHTLSTAGGHPVTGANFLELAEGTVKGGSPNARVAAYKACWPTEDGRQVACASSDVLEALDDAIKDGVDVLSLSIGSHTGTPFEDAVSVGTFHAVMKGIHVICSAGNGGPEVGTVANIPPWIITVAASSFDREFRAYVRLKNGRKFKGESLSPASEDKLFYPLISGAQAKKSNVSANDSLLCKEGSLDYTKVNGKILVCLRGENERIEKGRQASLAGAVGMILCNDKSTGDRIEADPHVLPASHLTYNDGLSLFSYMNFTKNPQAKLLPSTTSSLDKEPAPVMAPFSSLGPNLVTPEILKPDITAPGVLVLGANTEAQTNYSNRYINGSSRSQLLNNPKTPYMLMSGTSMSCAHVAGSVGLLKSINPNWSPAAVRSAIVTTARSRDNTEIPVQDFRGIKATPFHYGHGHLRPNRAADPGLIYDLKSTDYLDFLCAIGYNKTTIEYFNGNPYTCPSQKMALTDFNYPSITVPRLSGSVTVTRRVTNVALPGNYTVRVRQPHGFSVSVQPKVLRFDLFGQEKMFKVTIRDLEINGSKGYFFGRFIWSSDKYHVRSPISVARA